MRISQSIGPIILGLVLATPQAAHSQEVFKNVSSARLERLLADMNITYKKSSGTRDGVHFYDYTRNGYKIRLHNYEGKDLWIDALFSDRMSPENVNRWNIGAKFSRCVLLTSNEKINVSLENQLDCLGGCTDAIIRQFITRFDTEVRNFAEFVKNAQSGS
jgi:hypothetical protein